MEDTKTKKITKNTIALTLRMFITMGISIYSSRIILQALGIVDYGIYNVISGVISMFSFLNTSMVASTQRFLNFSLGEKDYQKATKIFNTSINLHIFLSIVLIIVSEIIGVYFLNRHLEIPKERIYAANIIFQFTIITSVANIISVPYKALIIAYERMSIYAYEAIFQSLATLVASYLILYTCSDKLILYAFLLMIISILVRLFDGWYCSNKLSYKYHFIVDKKLSKEILSFSGWSTLVTLAHLAYTQGSIFLINIFYGPAINAAQALANQVNLSLLTFNSNFVMAIKPQIIKSYAEKDLNYMKQLLTYSLKISCLIMGIVTLPFIIKSDYILSLWLKEVPTYTHEFLQLALILSIFVSFSDPITTAIQATGKIKNYQISEFFFLISILPCTYILFKLNYQPYSTYFIRIAIFIFFLIVRLLYLNKLLRFSFKYFLYYVVLRIILSIFLSSIILFYIGSFFPDNIYSFILLCILSVFINSTISLYIAFNKTERESIITIIYTKIFKKQINTKI